MAMPARISSLVFTAGEVSRFTLAFGFCLYLGIKVHHIGVQGELLQDIIEKREDCFEVLDFTPYPEGNSNRIFFQLNFVNLIYFKK